jgi:two-component system response regulator LytT
MPKILIVEDQVLTANHIKNILNDNNWHQIEIAYKINQAIELLETFVPDIVLLDINVEGKNSGIEWAKKYVTEAKIIFITGQTELETLQLALSTNPISYLTKPVKKIDLVAAITLFSINIKPTYIVVKDGYDEVKINVDDILFIKSDANYIDIQLENKKFTIRKSLDSFLKEVQSDKFIKVHRSYIINQVKITKKTSTFLYIEDFEIPLSRNLDFKL